MLHIEAALSGLTERHQAALHWFVTHRGQERPWPESLPDGTLVATRAKGIYKPRWSKYALSIRESLDNPYSDQPPTWRPDGTWSYNYYQENRDPYRRDSEFTNLGLVECIKDGIPVGVLRQVGRSPKSRYQILGLAAVVGWEAGYFHFEGFSEEGLAYERRAQAQIGVLVERLEKTIMDTGYRSQGLESDREHVVTSVIRRRGQPNFRRALIEAYGGRCAISDCNAEPALEACHIRPYTGPRTNTLSNGLLLRADLHTLFDLGLLTIDPASMTVVLAPELEGTTYSEFAGRPVRIPRFMPDGSNRAALDWHHRWTGLAREV